MKGELDYNSSILTGHRAAISCLGRKSNDESVLYSGSDDKTIRLWDLRSNKVQKCIVGFDTSVTCLQSSILNEFLLFASSEGAVYSFDTRFSGVLSNSHISSMSDSSIDCINSISLNIKEEQMSIADDSQSITVIQCKNGVLNPENLISTNNPLKKLSRVHSSLIGSINYKKKNPTELVSGGFDCVCCIWDTTSRRPKSSVNFSITDNTSNQTFNPPFVQYCNYILEDKFVLCGLGDGTVSIKSPLL